MTRGRNPQSTSDPRTIREIFEQARTVAVVGLSDNPTRPSYSVARTLVEHGYRVMGINPNLDEVLGAICYPNLASVPETIDVVDVFRQPEAVPAIVAEVIKLQIPYLWLQEGIVHPTAVQQAIDAGIKVVMDRCMAKELYRNQV